MEFWRYMDGILCIELTSADLLGAISVIEKHAIAVWNIESVSDITIRFCVQRTAWKKLRVLLHKRGDEINNIRKTGLYWSLGALLRRPVLVLGIFTLLMLHMWLQGRILFVQVQGNTTTDTRMILETAGKCGISFGASSREVRSEEIKNALLQAMPELSWAGVNTYGCTAVISVKERTTSEQKATQGSVSSIVAVRDGIVRQMTVLQGTGACTTGQAVKEGQMLISGYTDCGILIQATNAKGEVFAETNREICAIFPAVCQERGEKQRVIQNYSLIIGKKRINFSNNSGISGTGCAKIYEEKYLTLPGGFVLPVAIAVETIIWYDTEAAPWQCDLSAVSQKYLQDHMCAGRILQSDEEFEEYEGLLIMRGSYSCYEMIGVTKIEERILDYVENNRKNR